MNNMHPKDAKTRKRWFIVTFLYGLFIPLGIVAFFAVISRTTTIQIPFIIIKEAVITAFYSFISFFILWLCAYRKPGTIALTMSLIFTPLTVLYNLYTLVSLPSPLATSMKTHFIIHTALITVWYVLSIKLRKINRNIQISHLRSST